MLCSQSSPNLKLVALLLSWPLGRLWYRIVPQVRIFGYSLNPGPWTIKEHVLVMVMSGVGVLPAYAVRPPLACNSHGYSQLDKSDIIAAQRIYYHQHWSFTCATSTIPLFYVSHESIFADQWLLVTSTNLIGFSAGISHCFVSIPLRLTSSFARRHHAKIPSQTSFDEWVFSVYAILCLAF
jgi:hypothetical protein